ncbi:MAG TPA: hypothetical protein VEQ66_14420 [Propionibacteriaceae bacterium]|nr:hypothetical protein [Propionibacteriaceae bacterium]
MNKRLAAGLGALAALAMTTTGVAPASAGGEDPYPESEGWQIFNFNDTLRAGYVCNVDFKARVKGHVRVTVNGKLPPKDWKGPKPGDLVVQESPDATATITNAKNRQKVKLDLAGPVYSRVSKNGKDLKSRSVGGNLYFGNGVKGLLYAKGTQWFSVYNFKDPVKVELDLHRTQGSTVELCHFLGAKAVRGKNPPPQQGQSGVAHDLTL